MDKSKIAINIHLYGKNVIETLEEILKNLEATHIRIENDFMHFFAYGQNKNLNLKSLFNEIFENMDFVNIEDIYKFSIIKIEQALLKS